MRLPAVRFRGKTYVRGPFHQDALDLMFEGWSRLSVHRAHDRVADGREDIVFGFANADGTDWVDATSQGGRKRMYGFA